MKLIDLLVQELPKRGGWPISDNVESMHYMIENHNCSYGRTSGGVRYFESDETGESVTFEDYEAALAASQQPAWSGEGLPPVGCEFEYGRHRTKAKCLGVGVDMVFACKGKVEEDDYEEFMISIKDSCFRPIPTEAERKREEAIKFMNSVFRDHVDNKKSNGQDSVFHAIYDAFKAGKFE